MVIKNNLSYEDRIQNRIKSFCDDLQNGDGDMTHIEDVLRCIHDYMIEYNDDDIAYASYNIKKAIFFVESFNIE